jgi:hypothetical protein
MTSDAAAKKDKGHLFTGTIKCSRSGKCGFALRVLPKHEDLAEPYEPGLVVWENNN